LRCYRTHFLGYIQADEAARVYPRNDLHDDARRMVVDAVDDRRAGGEGACRGAGQDRNLLANLQTRRLVVEHCYLRCRQDPDLGYLSESLDRVTRSVAEDEARKRRWKGEAAEMLKGRARSAEGFRYLAGFEEELSPVLQRIVEVNLGNRRFDQHLQR